jgi:TonB family protein
MTSNTLLWHLLVVVPGSMLMAAGSAMAQDSGHPGQGVSDLQRERTPVTSDFPEYPEDARRDRLEGEATVCYTVDALGQVVRPKISTSTHRIFEKPALRSIRASTFKPLEAGEVASPLESCRTYRFRLEQLDPLYVSNESTTPAPLSEGAESFAASSVIADPQIEETSLALAGTGADALIAHDTVITGATPLPPEEPICTTAKRPGTRIDSTVCFTPRQQTAITEHTERVIHDGAEEIRARDQAILESQMKHGGVIGPLEY